MRLQLSALGARPMNTQQQAPFTPQINKSKVSNPTPALAQRQGLTKVALEELERQLSKHIGDLATAKNNNKTSTIKFIELRIRNLVQLADYYALCLRDPERLSLLKNWAPWTDAKKLIYIKEKTSIGEMLNIDTTAHRLFFDHHYSFSASNGSTDEELADKFQKFADMIRTKKALKAYIERGEYRKHNVPV